MLRSIMSSLGFHPNDEVEALTRTSFNNPDDRDKEWLTSISFGFIPYSLGDYIGLMRCDVVTNRADYGSDYLSLKMEKWPGKEQFRRIYDKWVPGETGFEGVTTDCSLESLHTEKMTPLRSDLASLNSFATEEFPFRFFVMKEEDANELAEKELCFALTENPFLYSEREE